MSEFLPDFKGAAVAPSPNHGERQGVAGPDIILLHYTGMTTADGALSWLCNPESQVSSHYFVFEDGRVIQMVPETRRAWHAGKSTWAVDPGEKFPWDILSQHGVGHWVEPAPIRGGRFFQRGDHGQPVEALQSMLSIYGYGVEITGAYCEKTEGAVAAFQRHFRPALVDGIADFSTIDTLHRLIASLPKFSAA